MPLEKKKRSAVYEANLHRKGTMNLLRPRAVTCTDVDIGIKMRRDYKGDLRKVLDRPSRLATVGVAGARSIFRRLFPSGVFTTHPLHRISEALTVARAGDTMYI